MTEETVDFYGFKYCACGYCNELIPIRDKWGRFRKYRNGHCSRGKEGTKGDKNGNWKGGRRIISGYIYILKPNHPYRNANNSVAEHRLEMEEYLGRYMTPEEEVHHLDLNKENNIIGNLMLFANSSEHAKYEKVGIHIAKKTPEQKRKNRTCLICGGSKTSMAKGGTERWYRYLAGFICRNCHLKQQRKKKNAVVVL
jgi:hypothetical protein